MGCRRGRVILGVWVFCGGVCGGGWVWVVCVMGVGGMGNNVEACCMASLMDLGMYLYVFWNSFGVSMALMVWFWICVSVVMPYMYSLFRYFWVLNLEFSGMLV